MKKFNAVLVEDEPSSARDTIEALDRAGFDVTTFTDATSALEADAGKELEERRLVDLIVLDRRLPQTYGDPPLEAVGDELLGAMLQRYPDAPAVVFSGYTNFHHQQFATYNRGVIPLVRGQETFDRVTLFEKGQTLEFDEHIGRVRDALRRIDDVQLLPNGLELPERDRRLLRRVALEYGGASVTVDTLEGGLSGSPIWYCSIQTRDHTVANVVVKRQKSLRRPGGFESLLPAGLTAGTVLTVEGFCGGSTATVQLLVGRPTSLMSLLETEPEVAAAIAQRLVASLSLLPSGLTVNYPISDVAACVEDWGSLCNRAEKFGIEMPPGSRIASSVNSAQHGDLHPGNVLVSDGQPVLIDFDNQLFGSETLDGTFLLLGPLFHPASPLRGLDWPTIDQCSDLLNSAFLANCPATNYFSCLIEWLKIRQCSDRELFAVIAAYAIHQLKYPDVADNDLLRGRATAIAQWAIEGLQN